MKMMGLSNAVHWVAWFIVGFTQMSLTIAAFICILRYGQILVHSNPFIVWLTLTIFAMATICFWSVDLHAHGQKIIGQLLNKST